MVSDRGTAAVGDFAMHTAEVGDVIGAIEGSLSSDAAGELMVTKTASVTTSTRGTGATCCTAGSCPLRITAGGSITRSAWRTTTARVCGDDGLQDSCVCAVHTAGGASPHSISSITTVTALAAVSAWIQIQRSAVATHTASGSITTTTADAAIAAEGTSQRASVGNDNTTIAARLAVCAIITLSPWLAGLVSGPNRARSPGICTVCTVCTIGSVQFAANKSAIITGELAVCDADEAFQCHKYAFFSQIAQYRDPLSAVCDFQRHGAGDHRHETESAPAWVSDVQCVGCRLGQKDIIRRIDASCKSRVSRREWLGRRSIAS